MDTEYDDIKMVGLDVRRTCQSPEAPGLRHMFLELSRIPPPEWVESFRTSRTFARHSMWREAWIEGNYIVVDCVPEEIEKYHLQDLKEDVSNANAQYRDHLQQVHNRETKQHATAAAERQRLDTLANRLKFDSDGKRRCQVFR